MSNVQDITRDDRKSGREALFVADETNCVRWIRLAAVTEFGAEEPDVPYIGRCDRPHCFEGHQWRRVYVKI
jgi:hypothetical protein